MELPQFSPSTWIPLPIFHLQSQSDLFFSILSSSLLLFLIATGLYLFKPQLLPRRRTTASICCRCDTCRAYLTSSWTADFPSLSDWYTHLLRNSPTQTINVHVLGATITANPVNVEHILKTKFDNYPKGKTFSTILGDLLGKGIFNVDGHMWLLQRKMASKELGKLAVKSYALEVVTAEINTRLLPLLSSICCPESGNQPREALDLQDVFRRFSFDLSCKFSFGLDPGCLEEELSLPLSDFAVSFDLATKLSAERALVTLPLIWKVKRILGLGKERELTRAVKRVDLLAKEVIRQKRKLGDLCQNDLLSRFMATANDDDKLLRDIVISFILAGRDSVASALTGFFWLIPHHSRVRDKIRQEYSSLGVKTETVEDHNYYPSLDQIRNMQYLHAAVYEGMRLYPPVQFNSKFALNDDVLPDNTCVSSGTRVTYHPYAMGRMETIWGPDYAEFKPERWLNDDGVFSPVSPFKYPVFQGGIRTCLGKELAVVQIKCTVVAVLDRFDVEVVEPAVGSETRFDPGLTANFQGGLRVVVRKRIEV